MSADHDPLSTLASTRNLPELRTHQIHVTCYSVDVDTSGFDEKRTAGHTLMKACILKWLAVPESLWRSKCTHVEQRAALFIQIPCRSFLLCEKSHETGNIISFYNIEDL
jgi:hypothetical protein